MDDMMKVRKALFMFVDLFGVDRFDYDTLVRGAICYLQYSKYCWLLEI